MVTRIRDQCSRAVFGTPIDATVEGNKIVIGRARGSITVSASHEPDG